MAARKFIYSHGAVRRKGHKDGRAWRWTFFPFRIAKQPQPALDQSDPAQYEVALKEAAEHDIGLLGTDWATLDVRLKTDYCKAAIELQTAEASFKKEQGEATAAQPIYEAARTGFLAVDAPALSAGWRGFWLSLIAITELPLNGLVFQILGQSKLETYIMAFGLVIAVPLLAHFVGSALRKRDKLLTDKVLMGIGPLVLLGILSAIAVFRAEYFAITASSLGGLGMNLNPTQAAVLFVLLNFGLFFVAMLVSYEGSHADKATYNRCKARLRDASRELAKETGEAQAAAARLERANQVFQTTRTERQKRYGRFASEARGVKESADWYAQVYRTANMEVRAAAERPVCFKSQVLQVTIPKVFAAELDGLDWDCAGLQQGGA